MPINSLTILDDALSQIDQAFLIAASRLLSEFQQEAEEICPECGRGGEYSASQLAHITEGMSRTILRIIDAAPYHSAKAQLEASDKILEWLFHSTKYVGEQRAQCIAMIRDFQKSIQSLVDDHDPQGQLL